MKKPISELTPEEWEILYPITVKEHNPHYKDWYETERQLIVKKISADDIIRINHFGSSAVEGLLSKNTIDILLEIDGGCIISELTTALQCIGYDFVGKSDTPFILFFAKGYLPEGYDEKVYNLHVRYFGNWKELYFRDYLIENPDVANEYSKLKLEHLEDSESNRGGYTLAKKEFVLKYSDLAKQRLQDKYKYIS